MTTQEFTLPDLGEGLTESELVSWEVAVGDTVELNQIIGEVETAKALVQLPSPFAGVIGALLVEPGTTVAVGQPIVRFEVEVEATAESEPGTVAESPVAPEVTAVPQSPAASEATAGPEAIEGQPTARNSVLVGYGPKIDDGVRPQRRHRRPDWEPKSDSSGEASAPRTRTDADRRTPVAGVQRRMAEAMVQSAFSAPHANVQLTVDVTASVDLLARLREHPRLKGHRVSILTLVAKACLIALRNTPAINSHWDDSANEIVEFAHVNLGIAAATERGLLVPNIRAADTMALAELADAVAELTAAARDATTTPAQLSGGTFTITNIGVFGVDSGTPILPPGEGAILAMGSIRRLPWEHEGELALRSVMTLTLSFDHRLIDGRQAATFLAEIGGVLVDPGSALAFV